MLDVDGEVVDTSLCAAEADEAALVLARVWLARYPAVEVWSGSKVVGTLASAGTYSRGRPVLQADVWDPSDRLRPSPDFHPLVS